MTGPLLPVVLMVALAVGVAVAMVLVGRLLGPRRRTSVKSMPYESGMDPIHDARRRFDVRFHLVAIAFLLFDVELLFLYPWAVSSKHTEGIDAVVEQGVVADRGVVFFGVMFFLGLLVLGLVYEWRKGVLRWR